MRQLKIIPLRFHLLTVLIVIWAVFIISSNTESSFANERMDYTIKMLDNGLKVICMEDHTFPLVAVVTAVRVGSRYESEKESGISHLLEHLLFKGTKTRGYKEVNEALEAIGGYNNAFTRKDYTAFEIVVPSEHLEKGLEIQSDMLFNSIIPPHELERERGVVISEIDQKLDHPLSYLQRMFERNFYQGTPYSKPILGSPDTISAISRNQILHFYRNYYIPSNMTIAAVGDFEKDRLISLIKAYYGHIPPKEKPKAKHLESEGVRLPQDIIEEYDTGMAFMKLGFKIPTWRNEDIYAVDLLSSILASGENSRLSDRLKREKGLVSYIGGEINIYRELSSLEITAILDEDNIEMVKRIIIEEIDRLKVESVPEREIDKAKVRYETSEAFQKEKFLWIAREIAGCDASTNVHFRLNYLDNIMRVDSKDIKKVAQKYLNGCMTVILKPKNKKNPEKTGMTSNIKKEVLENGLTVIAVEKKGAPVNAIHFLIKGGMSFEPHGKNGVALLVSKMLKKGTKRRSEKEILEALDSIGAKVDTTDNPFISMDDFYNSKDFSYLHYQAAAKYFDRGLEVVSDIIKNPSFPSKELEKVKMELKWLIDQQKGNPSNRAYSLFLKTIFPDHPYGRPAKGTMESITRLTREDVLEYYDKFYRPNNMIVTVVADYPPEISIRKIKQYFQDMTKKDIPIPQLKHVPFAYTPQRIAEEMEKEQAYIYLGHELGEIDREDLPALTILNEILGRSAQNRLALSVREEKGWAYSVGSSLVVNRDANWLVIGMGVKPENIDTAISIVVKEIEKIKDTVPPTKKELKKAINGLVGERLRYRQRAINQAHFLGRYEALGMGYQYDLRFSELIKDLRIEDMVRVAKKYLHPHKLVIVVVRPPKP